MNFSFLEAKAQRGGATVKCLDCEADMSVLGKWVIVAGRGGCTYMGACSTTTRIGDSATLRYLLQHCYRMLAYVVHCDALRCVAVSQLAM